MSQPREKDPKDGIIIAESGSESPVASKEGHQVRPDGQGQNETEKTWRSFFWSSEHLATSGCRKTIC